MSIKLEVFDEQKAIEKKVRLKLPQKGNEIFVVAVIHKITIQTRFAGLWGLWAWTKCNRSVPQQRASLFWKRVSCRDCKRAKS